MQNIHLMYKLVVAISKGMLIFFGVILEILFQAFMNKSHYRMMDYVFFRAFIHDFLAESSSGSVVPDTHIFKHFGDGDPYKL